MLLLLNRSDGKVSSLSGLWVIYCDNLIEHWFIIIIFWCTFLWCWQYYYHHSYVLCNSTCC